MRTTGSLSTHISPTQNSTPPPPTKQNTNPKHRWIYDKDLVAALFDGAADRYGDREGGYCRVLRTLPRKGDNAPMAVLELV